MPMQLALRTSPTGPFYLDLTPFVFGLEVSTGPHGFGRLKCRLRLNHWDSFLLYDRRGLPHVTLSDCGQIVWEGRLEDVAIVPGGVRLTALGYWRALYDVPYTALFSTTSTAGWRPVTPAEVANRTIARWQWDNNNRLYLAPRKGDVFESTTQVGALTFAAPEDGNRSVYYVSFDYDFTVPSSTWRARLSSATEAFGSLTAEWDLAAGTASGSATVTLTSPNPRLLFSMWYDSGSPTTYSGETGAAYLKITNLRINGQPSATFSAGSIALYLLAYINGINANQLSSSTALIQSAGLPDLTDEVHEDAWPADILDHLAALGDNQTPPRQWEAGVWENRILHFRPRGTGARAWFVDVAALEVQRTLELLRNSAYATYQEAGGRKLRTAVSADTDSIARYGLTRRAKISAQTTSSTQAGIQRDAYLEDNADPKPRAGLEFYEVYDGGGARWPLWLPRSGDTFTIRNLPPGVSADVDRLRTFRLSETRLIIDENRLEVIPEEPRPTLETLLARRGAGLG